MCIFLVTGSVTAISILAFPLPLSAVLVMELVFPALFDGRRTYIRQLSNEAGNNDIFCRRAEIEERRWWQGEA